jgi:hypothetical protein
LLGRWNEGGSSRRFRERRSHIYIAQILLELPEVVSGIEDSMEWKGTKAPPDGDLMTECSQPEATCALAGE